MMYEYEAVLYVQYLIPDLLDHLDSISSTQDPYSNKQWNQPSHHVLFDTNHFKEELKSNQRDPWEHKQHYCFDSSYGEHHILYDTDHFKEEMKSNRCKHDILCSNQEPLKRAHPDPKAKLYTMSLCSNPDPLKHTHSPQGMLSLISPTGCCVMKRKDGECPDPEVKLYHRGAYQRYIGKHIRERNYVWGDNESMSNSPTVPEAKLHKQHNILLFLYIISMILQGYINLQHLASE